MLRSDQLPPPQTDRLDPPVGGCGHGRAGRELGMCRTSRPVQESVSALRKFDWVGSWERGPMSLHIGAHFSLPFCSPFCFVDHRGPTMSTGKHISVYKVLISCKDLFCLCKVVEYHHATTTTTKSEKNVPEKRPIIFGSFGSTITGHPF